MSIEKERKAFEDWASKETSWDLYWSENINQYMDHQTNAAWFAWKASTNREGYKLVPVEPTDDMLNIYEKYSIAPIGKLSKRGYKAMIGAIE